MDTRLTSNLTPATDQPACCSPGRDFAHRRETPLAPRGIERGGYVLADAEGPSPDIILIATGSEVDLAVQARARLALHDIQARVVSMPSTTVFDRQDAAYRRIVLPPGVRRVAIEAGVTAGWWKYVGLDGAVIGIDRFGESAPGDAVFAHLGFTVESVVETTLALCRQPAVGR